MAKKKEKEKTPLKKGRAEFELVGIAKINNNTFTLNAKSKTSDWIYNRLNIGVDCGAGNVVYCEAMGGYGSQRKENFVYNVKGKKLKEGTTDKYTDDFSNIFNIAWEDRFNKKVLDEVGEGSFLRAGVEKDKDGKTFTKKFLSEYDLIAYLNENQELIKDKAIRIKGEIEYSVYEGSTQVKKNIKSVYISEAKEEDFKASFTQTILVDKDSIGRIDKETGLIPLYAIVVDYTKLYNGKEVKTNIPFQRTFYFDNEKLAKVLKVKKGVTEIQVTGDIIEGQAKATLSIDDLPEDIRELIEIGAYTEEEAVKSLSIRGERVNQWTIKKPVIIMKGDEDNKVPVILKTEERYTEEDLILDFMINNEEDEDDSVVEEGEVEVTSDDVDEDWLNDLE